MTGPDMTLFDRALVRRRRDRAGPRWSDHAFLIEETAARLVERLDDVARSFPLALDLGCHGGEVARALADRDRIGHLVQCDLSPVLARRAAAGAGGAGAGGAGATTSTPTPTFVADEEWLPLRPQGLDLVLSNLSLHWVNDLPGVLIQIRRSLRPDGLVLASLLGGRTLEELRLCLAEAEQEEEGGLSPRTSPLADVRALGDLLVRAGFAVPTVDAEVVTVRYQDPMRLLTDLRGMGETNAITRRPRRGLRRATLARALALYRARFAGADGRVPATFEVITLTAWAPAAP